MWKRMWTLLLVVEELKIEFLEPAISRFSVCYTRREEYLLCDRARRGTGQDSWVSWERHPGEQVQNQSQMMKQTA